MARKKKRGVTEAARERMRKQAQQRQSGNYGGDAINLPEGVEAFRPDGDLKRDKRCTSYLDVLPYEVTQAGHPDEVEVGEFWWRRRYFMARDVGPSKKRVASLKSWNEDCPILDAARELMDSSEEKLRDVGFGLRPKERWLLAVFDQENPDKGVQVLDISVKLFGELLEGEYTENEEYMGFWDPQEGFTLKIRWVAESMGSTKFWQADRIDFEDRDEVEDELLDEVPDLDECLIRKEFKELQDMLLAGDDDGDEEEEEETTSRRGRRGNSTRRTKKDEEEDDLDYGDGEEDPDSDEGEGDGDEEEEQKPKRGRRSTGTTSRRRRRPAKEEEEPDPDEEEGTDPDEEEEEERPTRRRRRSAKKAPAGNDEDPDEEEDKPASRARGRGSRAKGGSASRAKGRGRRRSS